VPVRPHHVEREPLLMQAVARFTSRIRAHLGRRHKTARLHVLHRQARLECDRTRRDVVGVHEHRRDYEVLTRRESTEIHKPGLQLIRRAQRSIVGLIDRTCSVRVAE
jgi:hypothetical protein